MNISWRLAFALRGADRIYPQGMYGKGESQRNFTRIYTILKSTFITSSLTCVEWMPRAEMQEWRVLWSLHMQATSNKLTDSNELEER